MKVAWMMKPVMLMSAMGRREWLESIGIFAVAGAVRAPGFGAQLETPGDPDEMKLDLSEFQPVPSPSTQIDLIFGFGPSPNLLEAKVNRIMTEIANVLLPSAIPASSVAAVSPSTYRLPPYSKSFTGRGIPIFGP